MSKRPSLFGKAAPAAAKAEEPAGAGEPKATAERPEPAQAEPATREVVTTPRYPKSSTREGKRVVTAYLDPEAFRQLKRVAADEDQQQQDLLIEAINLLFEKRGLSRIA